VHGAFRVMLVGLRIPKIGQYTVPHVLRDVPAIALDNCRAAPVISPDDSPQVLGIEFR